MKSLTPITLSLYPHSQDLDKEEEPDLKDKGAPKVVSCRLCHGQHFTLKCPYKESFTIPEGGDAAPAEGTFCCHGSGWGTLGRDNSLGSL